MIADNLIGLLLIILLVIIIVCLWKWDFRELFLSHKTYGGLAASSVMKEPESKADVVLYDFENLYMTTYRTYEAIRDLLRIGDGQLLCKKCVACQLVSNGVPASNGYAYQMPHENNNVLDLCLQVHNYSKSNIFNYRSPYACSKPLMGTKNNFILKKYAYPLQTKNEWNTHFNDMTSTIKSGIDSNYLDILPDLATLLSLENLSATINNNYIYVNIVDIYSSAVDLIYKTQVTEKSTVMIGIDIWYLCNNVEIKNPYDFKQYSLKKSIDTIKLTYLSDLITFGKRQSYILILVRDLNVVLYKLLYLIMQLNPAPSPPSIIRNILMMSKLITYAYNVNLSGLHFGDVYYYPNEYVSISIDTLPQTDVSFNNQTFAYLPDTNDVVSSLKSKMLGNLLYFQDSSKPYSYNTFTNSFGTHDAKQKIIPLDNLIADYVDFYNIADKYINELNGFCQLNNRYLKSDFTNVAKTAKFRTWVKACESNKSKLPKKLFDSIALYHFLLSCDDYILLSLASELTNVTIISNDKFKDWYMYYLPSFKDNVNSKAFKKFEVKSKLLEDGLAVKNKDGEIQLNESLTTNVLYVKETVPMFIGDYVTSKAAKYLVNDGFTAEVKASNDKYIVTITGSLPINTTSKFHTIGIDTITLESYVKNIDVPTFNSIEINRNLDVKTDILAQLMEIKKNKSKFSLLN
jgi:hypothetical protein